MDSVDLHVLRNAIDWLEQRHRVTLVTVVKTWGSAPRPPGSWLAMRANGQLVGSVSGGCVEDDLISKQRDKRRATDTPELVSYGVSKEEAARFGLPCGGQLQLLIEPRPDIHVLRQLLAAIQRRELVARRVNIQTGYAGVLPAQRSDALHFDGKQLVTVHGPRYRLLIIGAGQTSHFLAQIAQTLDYEVLVCDPREAYRQSWQVAGVPLLASMPDDTVVQMQPDTRSAVVALTHDPKLDDMALLEALKSPAFYVGALGSRANNAKRRKRLRLFDLSDAEISRLHGPVGLPIGSHTPPEIAIAILAEMTALRHGITLEIAQNQQPEISLRQPALKLA
jgi:xanthine dehydrogenase accessory factor